MTVICSVYRIGQQKSHRQERKYRKAFFMMRSRALLLLLLYPHNNKQAPQGKTLLDSEFTVGVRPY
jgi:hypothetical protein